MHDDQHRAADVLVVSGDPAIVDDVRRLAAAAGVTAAVLPDALAAVPHWLSAHVVVIDGPCLDQAVQLCLPVRSKVVVVIREGNPSALWRLALEVGSRSVISLPEGEQWLIEALGKLGLSGPTRAPVITVIGARGGAGASVLATTLARVAATESLSCYLIDLDPLSCGVHVYFGADSLSGVGWEDLHSAIGRIPADLLRQGLPVVEGVRLLTWLGDGNDLPPVGVVGSVLDAAASDADLVVIDLPRWLAVDLGSTASPIEALTRTDEVLLVCPSDVRSTLAAHRLLRSPSVSASKIRLVVRGPAPGGVVGADIAAALGRPVVAEIPAERRLDHHLEDGIPAGFNRRSPLRGVARSILRQLPERVGMDS